VAAPKLPKSRHPFQRRGRGRRVVRTPFQQALVAALARNLEAGKVASGRELSAALGRSANHLNLMLNKGFVPSGEAVLDLARVLELTEAETEAMVRAAIITKASRRSRDRFWLTEALRLLARAERRIAELEGRSGSGAAGPPRARES
jgi:hypothetical protein